MKKIRVLVAEDHNVVREGLVSILNRAGDMTVVAEARDGVEAIAQFTKTTPDVAMLDLEMPRLSGLEAIRQIRELNIGHFLMGEAMFIGLEASIREMRRLMNEARAP